jgi:hypothetical protein
MEQNLNTGMISSGQISVAQSNYSGTDKLIIGIVLAVRYAAGIGLIFNVFMIIVAMVAIIITVSNVTSKSVSK